MFSHWDLSVLAFVLTKTGVEMQKPLKRCVSMCKRLRWTKQNNENKPTKEGSGIIKRQSQTDINPACVCLLQHGDALWPVFPAGSECLHWEPGSQMLNILLEEAEANSGNQTDLLWNFLSISLIPVMLHWVSSVLVVSGHWSNSGSLLQEGRVSLHLLHTTCSFCPSILDTLIPTLSPTYFISTTSVYLTSLNTGWKRTFPVLLSSPTGITERRLVFVHFDQQQRLDPCWI